MYIEQINKIYHPIIRGVKVIKNENINSLIVKSNTGLGKSYMLDKILKELKVDYVLFKGSITEARFFQFIQENKNKCILLRDTGNLLKNSKFLDFLKSATDTIKVRKISRLNYAEHDIEDTIEFTGKLIWEINDIPKRNQEDLDAVISRSLFIELNPSRFEIKDLMLDICKKRIEKRVTNYLIEKSVLLGRNEFNLRTQTKCLAIAKSSIRDRLDWKKSIDLFLTTHTSEPRKLLYRLTGEIPVKRIEFVKYLMKEKNLSYSIAHKRIDEWILLEEIYSESKLKQAKICLNVLNVSK